MTVRYQNLLAGIELDAVKATGALVPTLDSAAALVRARDIAKADGSKLVLAHVLDVDPLARTWLEKAGEGRGTYIGEAKAALAHLAAEAATGSVAATTVVAFGRPVEELGKLAASGKHDLVLVGRRRPASPVSLYSLRGALLGTTANKMLHSCPAPVLVVRPDSPRPYARIVAATDLSPLGERVLEHAMRIAVIEGAELHVVHAVDRWYAGRSYLFGSFSGSIERELGNALVDARGKLAQQVAAVAERTGLSRNPIVNLEVMPPEELILRVARIESADLVVLGTAGRQGVPGFLVGNTCERLLPELGCALLAVR